MVLIALASCSTQTLVPVEHTVVAAVPDTLLTCKDAPAVPGPTATQRDVVPFQARLGEAWKSCHGNLATVKDLIEKQRVELDQK